LKHPVHVHLPLASCWNLWNIPSALKSRNPHTHPKVTFIIVLFCAVITETEEEESPRQETVKVTFETTMVTEEFHAEVAVPVSPEVEEDTVQPEAHKVIEAPITWPEDEGEAPKFVIPLQELEVDEGGPVVMECRVTGKPNPEVTWYVDDEELKDETVYITKMDVDGLCTLEIKDVFPEDEGEYMCKAVNPHGGAVTKAELFVRGMCLV
jgi:hypothetical protein